MVLHARSSNIAHGLVDERRKACGAGKLDMGCNGAVSPQHLLQSVAGLVVWQEREDMCVMCRI